MGLEHLVVSQVRIIEHTELAPSPGLNLVFGPNASGKTSLLEAIDLLSRGRSFRTRRMESLLTWGAAQLRVVGRIACESGPSIAIGIEKSRQNSQLRVAGRDAALSDLAAALPVQTLHPESHRLIEGSPGERRAFIDWGVFHVEPRFIEFWRRYHRALRQRNVALRAQKGAAQIEAWHGKLSEAADAIDRYRRAYCEALVPRARQYAQRLLGNEDLRLVYRRGWRDDTDLAIVLTETLRRDRQQGYTQAGPQRAELRVHFNDQPAAEAASRGQQKLLAAVLRLTQMELLLDRTGRSGVFLVDDLPSELDEDHRAALLTALKALNAQVFVTAIEPERLNISLWAQRKLFHVKQGRLEEVV